MNINRFYGLQDQNNGEEVNTMINQAYLAAPVVLGMYKADIATERVFLALFEEFNQSIFLYSDLPEEDGERGGGGDDLARIIFDNREEIILGLSVSFLYDILKIYGKKIFLNLKKFLIDSQKHKPQTIAVKIKLSGGASVTYRLPKHLSSAQIETAVERIENDCLEEKTVQEKLWTRLIYDTKEEKFEEE